MFATLGRGDILQGFRRGASFVKVEMYIKDEECECSVQIQQDSIGVFLIEMAKMYQVILLNGV
jgi:hypothetical protein